MSYGFKRGEGKTLPMVITKDNCISRGRFINNVEYKKTDKAEFLTVEVKDRDGFTARKSYFPPKLGMYIKTEEDLKKEIRAFNSSMENLTKAVLGVNYETSETSSFEEFCKRIIADLGRAYYNKELRIKVVYDSKNRPTLPKWPVVFEDPTLVSDDRTKMKVTEYDKVTPVEIKMDDEPTETKKVEDDLPF